MAVQLLISEAATTMPKVRQNIIKSAPDPPGKQVIHRTLTISTTEQGSLYIPLQPGSINHPRDAHPRYSILLTVVLIRCMVSLPSSTGLSTNSSRGIATCLMSILEQMTLHCSLLNHHSSCQGIVFIHNDSLALPIYWRSTTLPSIIHHPTDG